MATRKRGIEQSAAGERSDERPAYRFHLLFRSRADLRRRATRILEELSGDHEVIDIASDDSPEDTSPVLEVVLGASADPYRCKVELERREEVARCLLTRLDPPDPLDERWGGDEGSPSGTGGVRVPAAAASERDARAEFGELERTHRAELTPAHASSRSDDVGPDPDYLDFLDAFQLLDDAFDEGVDIDELTGAPGSGPAERTTESDGEILMTEHQDSTETDAAATSTDHDTPHHTSVGAADGERADARMRSDPGAGDDGKPTDGEWGGSEERPDPVSQLIDRLQSDDVDDEQRRELRTALGVQSQQALQTQLSHVQSRLSKFEAYSEALETFIAEHGDGQGLIDEFGEELDRLDAQVEDVGERLQDARAERSELRRELDHLEDRVDDLEADERTEDAIERVDALESDLESTTSELSEDLADLADRVDTLDACRRRMHEAMRSSPSDDGDGEWASGR